MNATEYLLMLMGAVLAAGLLDWLWLGFMRPRLTGRETQPEERIPPVAWIGAVAVMAALFVFVPLVGYAAGF